MTEQNRLDASSAAETQFLLEAKSDDEMTRWASAISLAEFASLESALTLHSLKSDPSVLVRTAAANSLASFPEALRKEMETSVAQDVSSGFVSEVWKSYPLPKFVKSVLNEYCEATLKIIFTEGPTTGSRIRRLLAEASLMGRSFNATKCLAVIEPLVESGKLTRIDRFEPKAPIDKMIFTSPGIPEIVVRHRDSRLITEIPVNEARAVLLANTRYKLRPNKNLGFEVLSRHYEIQQNELFLVGEALENQWEGLFD
jgi:hypothetical protein